MDAFALTGRVLLCAVCIAVYGWFATLLLPGARSYADVTLSVLVAGLPLLLLVCAALLMPGAPPRRIAAWVLGLLGLHVMACIMGTLSYSLGMALLFGETLLALYAIAVAVGGQRIAPPATHRTVASGL